MKTADIDRFWSKVDIGDPNSCWEWQEKLSNWGYGQMKVQGKWIGAHRIAWEIASGPIPNGLFVLHRCDNPLCANVAHLFLGGHDDNMADMIAKQRSNKPIGELNSNAKLTEAEVLEIRRLRDSSGLSFSMLAGLFDVSSSAISNIITRKSWRHIG